MKAIKTHTGFEAKMMKNYFFEKSKRKNDLQSILTNKFIESTYFFIQIWMVEYCRLEISQLREISERRDISRPREHSLLEISSLSLRILRLVRVTEIRSNQHKASSLSMQS